MSHYHFIGIGGTGLSAIARVLLEKGHQVSGSDQVMSPLAREIQDLGVKISIGHDSANVIGAEKVIRSSAIKDDNPEVIAARNAGISVIKRVDFLEELVSDQNVIAIAGTHGKTTTTSMIAWVLHSLGLDPSFVIGSIAKNMGVNAHYGSGEFFVIEADEYDNMFLGLRPAFSVITYVEHDHPDFFRTFDDYRAAFSKFVKRTQDGGTVFVCRDEPGSFSLIDEIPQLVKKASYGFHPESSYQAHVIPSERPGIKSFKVIQHADIGVRELCTIHLQIPGDHNILNATAVIALVDAMGLDMVKSAEALSKFSGAGRRFEIRGEAGGVIVVDDYAHHPTEIRATLQAAKEKYPDRRLVVVWQPHTFSRLQALFKEFTQAFSAADRVVITEIYAAREASSSFSASQIADNLEHPSVQFCKTLELAQNLLLEELRRGDLLLVLSAGDADQISTGVLDVLGKREVNHD